MTPSPEDRRQRAAWRPPMLAQTGRPAASTGGPPGLGWRYERKLDGLRCVAVRNGAEVELWSRNHLSFNGRFPDLVAGLARLGPDNFTLDGEIVAYVDGRTSFSALQRGDPSHRPVYCAFDLLWLFGQDTTALVLSERQALLAQALAGADAAVVAAVTGVQGDPDVLLRLACEERWEGLVAKQVGSTYRSGRSPAWRKLKCSAGQELVIAGWTEPTGTRTGFGALLVGYYDDDGRLRYAGKVGTGFDDKALRELGRLLTARARPDSPFADEVKVKGARWAAPDLVGAVAFTEWTADGRLRHPSFQGLRPDKPAGQVRRDP